MFTGIDPIISATRGTLTGYILWLATMAFVFAIIMGILG